MEKNHKIKLLCLITQGHWGGSQKYIFDLSRALDPNEFEITIAVGESAGEQDLQKKIATFNHSLGANIYLIQLQHLRRAISPRHDLLALFEILKLYKKIKPDLVHLNSSKAGILGSLARLKLNLNMEPKITIIYTAHGWVFNEPLPLIKRLFYRWAERLTARLKDRIIVLSPEDKQTAMRALAIAENRLVTILPGVALPDLILTKSEAKLELQKKLRLSFPEDTYLMGTITNFYRTKGIDILLNTFATKKPQLPRARLVLIGDGPEKNTLTILIKTLGLRDEVFLTGFLDDARTYLPAFDLFVLPSRKEGLPYTLLEAMMHEVPIIATRVGGNASLIENKKTGLIIPPENKEALGEALVFAYSHPDKMKTMAHDLYHEGIKKYQLETMVARTTDLYRSLLNLAKSD